MLSKTAQLSCLLCRPCTSTFHGVYTSAINNSLPQAKPNEDEMPQEASFNNESLNNEVIRRRPKKKEVNLIVKDTHLSEWTKMEPRGLVSAYLQLSKSKLTMLITSTAAAGYLMAPVGVNLSTLVACAAGTALLSSAANACNQLLEAPYDAQMKRTQSRVLVVHRFSPLHAFLFASACTASGIGLLYYACNPLTAALGALNLFLYAGVYTPMKRTHIGCKWAGAVVGLFLHSWGTLPLPVA